MPAYNAAATLSACLASTAGAENAEELEVIVVDDGSSDATAAIARAATRVNPSIRVVQQPNLGVAVARNTGLDAARGRYVQCLDADDALEPGHLEALRSAVAMCPAADAPDLIAFESIELRGERDVSIPMTAHRGGVHAFDSGQAFMAHARIRHESWWFALRRDFLNHHALRYETGRYATDVLFTFDALFHARRTLYLAQPRHIYRVSGDSIRRNSAPRHREQLVEDYSHLVERLIDRVERMPWREPGGLASQKWRAIAQRIAFFTLVRVARSDAPFDRLDATDARLHAAGAMPFTALARSAEASLPMRAAAAFSGRRASRWALFRCARLVDRLLRRFAKRTAGPLAAKAEKLS